jgi:hypothetical protein
MHLRKKNGKKQGKKTHPQKEKYNSPKKKLSTPQAFLPIVYHCCSFLANSTVNFKLSFHSKQKHVLKK